MKNENSLAHHVDLDYDNSNNTIHECSP